MFECPLHVDVLVLSDDTSLVVGPRFVLPKFGETIFHNIVKFVFFQKGDDATDRVEFRKREHGFLAWLTSMYLYILTVITL